MPKYLLERTEVQRLEEAAGVARVILMRARRMVANGDELARIQLPELEINFLRAENELIAFREQGRSVTSG